MAIVSNLRRNYEKIMDVFIVLTFVMIFIALLIPIPFVVGIMLGCGILAGVFGWLDTRP